MSLVLHYNNFEGQRKTRSWNPQYKQGFPVMISFHVVQENSKLKEIKKESKGRPSFGQVTTYIERLKLKYGDRLKQVMVWDLEALEQVKNKYERGAYFGGTGKGQHNDTRGARSA
ncbi:hypothetical protein ACPJHQ_25895 [Rossellomorea sp. H39__3]